jgi:hypothetical protein
MFFMSPDAFQRVATAWVYAVATNADRRRGKGSHSKLFLPWVLIWENQKPTAPKIVPWLPMLTGGVARAATASSSCRGLFLAPAATNVARPYNQAKVLRIETKG